MARSSRSSSIIPAGLIAALAAALIAWKMDHDHLNRQRENSAPKSQLQEMEASIVRLQQQQAQGEATIAQLKRAPAPPPSAPEKVKPDSASAEKRLTATERDYALLEAQFSDLRVRDDKLAADEARYFQLYSVLKEDVVSQREYIKGLYVDDLSLRTAARQPPYPALAVKNLDVAADTTISR